MNADKYTSMIAKSFALAVFLLIVVFTSVDADSITKDYSQYAYSVPTSLCHDPLLGPSMIIYSDCGQGQDTKERDNEDVPTVHGVTPLPPILPIVTNDPVEPITPPTTENPPIDNTTNDSKGNNGHGNNTDGCDSSNPSGKCPKKGTDDSAPIDDEKKVNKQINLMPIINMVMYFLTGKVFLPKINKKGYFLFTWLAEDDSLCNRIAYWKKYS